MNTRTTLACTMAIAALSGCARMAPTDPPTMGSGTNPDCPGRRSGAPTPVVVCLQGGVACGVPVEVVTGPDGACMVAIATDILQMRKSPSAPSSQTEIYWWLAGS